MSTLTSISQIDFGFFQRSDLWVHLIVGTGSAKSASTLLHVTSIHSTVLRSSIEVGLTPSSSTALEVTLFNTHVHSIHSVFLSLSSNSVPVVAVMLMSPELGSKLPVAVVVPSVCRGLIVVAVMWFAF